MLIQPYLSDPDPNPTDGQSACLETLTFTPSPYQVGACLETMEALTGEPGTAFMPPSWTDPLVFAGGRIDPLIRASGMAFGGGHNVVTPLTFNIGPIHEAYCWHMGPLAVMPLLANSPPMELAGFMAAFKRTCASSGMLTEHDEVEFVQPFRVLVMRRQD